MNKKDNITSKLLKWFEKNGRRFTWRSNHISFYRLLVCEIFLWKTQAATVNSFIARFFKKYPTPEKIEKTPIKSLINDIKVLGLSNRRAKLLKKTFSNYSNRNIPKFEKEFRKRFGVGQYIARSVLSIYYNQNLFPIDQNIYRFLKRVFNYEIKNIKNLTLEDELFLKDFIKKRHKRIIWAIIDFSSSVCKKRKPECNECVFAKYCYYFKSSKTKLSQKDC